jgi:hypothetical protein
VPAWPAAKINKTFKTHGNKLNNPTAIFARKLILNKLK